MPVPPDDADEMSIGVTAFKVRCLALIDDVARGKTRRVVLMKHNRPVAAIVPVESSPGRALGRAAWDSDSVARHRFDPGNRRGMGSRYLMMARAVLLDTRAAIWLMNGDRMSAQSRASVAAAQTANLGVYVSPMTAWEIATLVSKNRLQLTLSPEAWFDALLGFTGVRLAAMPPRC